MEIFLNQQDENAFKLTLQNKDCCEKNCFKTKINQTSVLKVFQNIKLLSKSDSNMFSWDYFIL